MSHEEILKLWLLESFDVIPYQSFFNSPLIKLTVIQSISRYDYLYNFFIYNSLVLLNPEKKDFKGVIQLYIYVIYFIYFSNYKYFTIFFNF